MPRPRGGAATIKLQKNRLRTERVEGVASRQRHAGQGEAGAPFVHGAGRFRFLVRPERGLRARPSLQTSTPNGSHSTRPLPSAFRGAAVRMAFWKPGTSGPGVLIERETE